MPYLPSPIKIWGKVTKRKVHKLRENLKPEADRGWKKQREETGVSFLWVATPQLQKPPSFKSPRVSKQDLSSVCATALPVSVCDMCSHSILMEPKAQF